MLSGMFWYAVPIIFNQYLHIVIIIIVIIIMSDNEQGTRVLTEAAISGDRNVIKREAEKILKYKDLTI